MGACMCVCDQEFVSLFVLLHSDVAFMSNLE